MARPYWDEIDLSQTCYDNNWTSKKLEADPRYTERLKIFDRWCRRWIEYYKRKEIRTICAGIRNRKSLVAISCH